MALSIDAAACVALLLLGAACAPQFGTRRWGGLLLPGFAVFGAWLMWRSAWLALRRGGTNVVWSTAHTGDEADAGIFAFERFGDEIPGKYALLVFNTHQAHASTPAFEGEGMVVSAPPGTVLVDALADGTSYTVGPEGTIDISVEPMKAALLVPEGEYEPGL